jgi:hypothetical protein
MSANIADTATLRSDADASPWWEVPRLTLALLRAHWPVLLFWFFAQRVAYDLLLALSIKLAERTVLLSFAALSLLIVTQLAGTIAMFLALRPSLPALAQTRGAGAMVTAPPWTRAVAIALLPFFAYYATWGLLDGLKRDFRLSYIFGVWYEQQEPLNDILKIKGLWIALLVAWAVRYISKRRAAAGGHAAWSVLATVCEAYWVFVGVAAIAKGIMLIKDWWHGRVVYVAVADWWQNPLSLFQLLPPIKRALLPLWDVAATAAGAVLMPLVWLAITAIVYGLDLSRRQRFGDADAQLRLLGRRYRGLHFAWRKLADNASAGWTSKGVPVVNSLRLVLRAGLPALLTLCLCWQLLAFVDAWAFRVVVELVGARDPDEWQLIAQPVSLLFNGPLSLRPALFTELLRVCLLAATFGCAVARLPRAVAT